MCRYMTLLPYILHDGQYFHLDSSVLGLLPKAIKTAVNQDAQFAMLTPAAGSRFAPGDMVRIAFPVSRSLQKSVGQTPIPISNSTLDSFKLLVLRRGEGRIDSF